MFGFDQKIEEISKTDRTADFSSEARKIEDADSYHAVNEPELD